MIEIQNVSKKYGNKLAVDDITFTIKKGEILGFLGSGYLVIIFLVLLFCASADGKHGIDHYKKRDM